MHIKANTFHTITDGSERTGDQTYKKLSLNYMNLNLLPEVGSLGPLEYVF